MQDMHITQTRGKIAVVTQGKVKEGTLTLEESGEGDSERMRVHT